MLSQVAAVDVFANYRGILKHGGDGDEYSPKVREGAEKRHSRQTNRAAGAGLSVPTGIYVFGGVECVW